MRSMIALFTLVFASSAFAMPYSSLDPEQRFSVESRLRDFVPHYKNAVEIATANVRANMPCYTKDTDPLSSIELGKWASVEALFEKVAQIYPAVRANAFFAGRGSQTLADLARESREGEFLMWATFRRPVEDRELRDQYLDGVMDVESLSPLVIHLSVYDRPGCAFVVDEESYRCR